MRDGRHDATAISRRLQELSAHRWPVPSGAAPVRNVQATADPFSVSLAAAAPASLRSPAGDQPPGREPVAELGGRASSATPAACLRHAAIHDAVVSERGGRWRSDRSAIARARRPLSSVRGGGVDLMAIGARDGAPPGHVGEERRNRRAVAAPLLRAAVASIISSISQMRPGGLRRRARRASVDGHETRYRAVADSTFARASVPLSVRRSPVQPHG